VIVKESFGSSVGGAGQERTGSAWWLVPDQLKIFFRGSLAKGCLWLG
jgi:hypothetical protein